MSVAKSNTEIVKQSLDPYDETVGHDVRPWKATDAWAYNQHTASDQPVGPEPQDPKTAAPWLGGDFPITSSGGDEPNPLGAPARIGQPPAQADAEK